AAIAKPVPPPVASVTYDPIFVCVVRNGRLEEVPIQYSTARGDSTYRGQPLSVAFPTDSTFALNAAWYRNNEPIAFGGGRYLKYGLPRILGPTDVVPVGAFRGVTVFAEPSAPRPRPDVIYLPVQPGCEFQPYEVGGIK
ncbi:MAG TPA: hypothetical protein VJT67_05020, partial [Longimicrobiaceae bacterium]|nr:hypothetical protein [Longimicrobiaceae bacterium]